MGFGANVEPKAVGDARLSIVVHGKDLNETFDVGTVKVAPDGASAEKPAEPKEETIAFSKEQQWALDFGTELAAEQSLRDTLRVAAETLPRTGGEAAVIAPAGGRLIVEKTFAVGTPVERGTELASILPPAGATTDLASLQLAEAEAKVSLEQAQRDRGRAERLLASYAHFSSFSRPEGSPKRRPSMGGVMARRSPVRTPPAPTSMARLTPWAAR